MKNTINNLFHIEHTKEVSNIYDVDTNTIWNYFSTDDVFEYIIEYALGKFLKCLQIMISSWNYFYQFQFLSRMYFSTQHVVILCKFVHSCVYISYALTF